MKQEVICKECSGFGCEKCNNNGFVMGNVYRHWNLGKITNSDTKLKIRRTHIKRGVGFVDDGKQISQYDLDNNLLTTWNNANEAEKCLSVKIGSRFIKRLYRQVISRCARGERKTAYGFIWKYENQ